MGLIDLGDVQYQELEDQEVALDDPEEYVPRGLWVEMTDNGTILWTRRLLSQRPLWHAGRL